jgi:hypothetical protein
MDGINLVEPFSFKSAFYAEKLSVAGIQTYGQTKGLFPDQYIGLDRRYYLLFNDLSLYPARKEL